MPYTAPVALLPYVRFVHLIAAAVWTGGLIVLAALVFALRKAGAERALLQVAARQFGRVSWTAMVIAMATGIWQVHLRGIPWSHGRLHIKIGIVALAVIVTGVHQVTAKHSGPAARGMMELAILVLGLSIYGAAVALGG